MNDTDYDPISDTLSCGCDPNWADHRCRYGCSRCGAPDDCYCPTEGELADSMDMTIAEFRIYRAEQAKINEARHLARIRYDEAVIELTHLSNEDRRIAGTPMGYPTPNHKVIYSYILDIICWS